jgi:hypothetical protein
MRVGGVFDRASACAGGGQIGGRGGGGGGGIESTSNIGERGRWSHRATCKSLHEREYVLALNREKGSGSYHPRTHSAEDNRCRRARSKR